MTMQAAGSPTLLAPVCAPAVSGENPNVGPDAGPGAFFAILAGLGGRGGGSFPVVATAAPDGHACVPGSSAVPEASEATVAPVYAALDALSTQASGPGPMRPSATAAGLTGRQSEASHPAPAASLCDAFGADGRAMSLAHDAPLGSVAGAPVDVAQFGSALIVYTISGPPVTVSVPAGTANGDQSTKQPLADEVATAWRAQNLEQPNSKPASQSNPSMQPQEPATAGTVETWSPMTPAVPAEILFGRDGGALAMDQGDTDAPPQLRNASAPSSQVRSRREHATNGDPAPGTNGDRDGLSLATPVTPTVTSQAEQLAPAALATTPGAGARPPQAASSDATRLLGGTTPGSVADTVGSAPAAMGRAQGLVDFARMKPSPAPQSRGGSIERNPTATASEPALAPAHGRRQAESQALGAASTAGPPTEAHRASADGVAAGGVSAGASSSLEQALADWASANDREPSLAGMLGSSSNLRSQAQAQAQAGSAAAVTDGVARPSSSAAALRSAVAVDRVQGAAPMIAGQSAPGGATQPGGVGASSSEQRGATTDDPARSTPARRSGARTGFDDVYAPSRPTITTGTASDPPMPAAGWQTPAHDPASPAIAPALVGGQPGETASLPLVAGLRAPAPASADPTRGSAPAPHDATPAAQTVPVLLSLASRGGSAALSLQLKPDELGHLHVRITRDDVGAAAVSVTVERADTLALLVRDQATLHRALDQAGVASPGRSISFHLASVDAQPAAQIPGGQAESFGGGQPGAHPQCSTGSDAGSSNGSAQHRREASRGQGGGASITADGAPLPGRTAMMTGTVNITA